MGDFALAKEPGEIFANQIDSLLQKRGWKQVDLAEQLDMTAKAVSKVLTEKRLPRDLLRWADALNVKVEWLLGRETGPSAEAALLPTRQAISALTAMAEAIGVDEKRMRIIRAALKLEERALTEAAESVENLLPREIARDKAKRGPAAG